MGGQREYMYIKSGANQISGPINYSWLSRTSCPCLFHPILMTKDYHNKSLIFMTEELPDLGCCLVCFFDVRGYKNGFKERGRESRQKGGHRGVGKRKRGHTVMDIKAKTKKGGFFDFFFFYVRYSTLLHLPPLRFNCVIRCRDRTFRRLENNLGRIHVQ